MNEVSFGSQATKRHDVHKLELSWAGNPRTVQVLVDLIHTKRPQFLFLMGTLLDGEKMEVICRKLGFDGCFVVDNLGHSEGLTLEGQTLG